MFGGEDEFLKIQGKNSIRIRPAKNDIEVLIYRKCTKIFQR